MQLNLIMIFQQKKQHYNVNDETKASNVKSNITYHYIDVYKRQQ